MSEQPTLFGEVALEKGYVSVEILSELGHMSEKQVLKVLNELHTEEKST